MPTNKSDSSSQSGGRKLVKKSHRRSSYQGHGRRTKKHDVYKKLYREASVRQKKREKLEQSIREMEAPQKYTPKINDYPVPPHEDISERLYDEHRKRREREVKKLSDVRNIDKECTFHPTIDSKSEKLVGGKDTQSRLLRPKVNYAAPPSSNLKSQENDLIEKKECTFHPHINKISSSQNQQGPVFDRLYEENKKRQSKIVKKRDTKDKECTFKPITSGYKISSRGDVYERLAQPRQTRPLTQEDTEVKVASVERLNQLYNMGLKKQKTRNLEHQGISTPTAVDDDNTLNQYNFTPKLETTNHPSSVQARSKVDCYNYGFTGHNHHTLGRNGLQKKNNKQNISDEEDDDDIQNNGQYQHDYANEVPVYGNGY